MGDGRLITLQTPCGLVPCPCYRFRGCRFCGVPCLYPCPCLCLCLHPASYQPCPCSCCDSEPYIHPFFYLHPCLCSYACPCSGCGFCLYASLLPDPCSSSLMSAKCVLSSSTTDNR